MARRPQNRAETTKGEKMNRDTVSEHNGRTGEMSGATADLRGRLAETYYRQRWCDGSWAWLAPQHKTAYYELVDVLLAEIADAGYELVATDRLDRLIAAGEEYEIELEWRCGEYLNVSRQCTSVLRDGDLEGAS